MGRFKRKQARRRARLMDLVQRLWDLDDLWRDAVATDVVGLRSDLLLVAERLEQLERKA